MSALTYNTAGKVTGAEDLVIGGVNYTAQFSAANRSYLQVFPDQGLTPTFLGQEASAASAVNQLDTLLNAAGSRQVDLLPFQALAATDTATFMVPHKVYAPGSDPLDFFVGNRFGSYVPPLQTTWKDPGPGAVKSQAADPRVAWVTFTSYWAEQGDAGDATAPQDIAGSVNGIKGSLGGTDQSDAFRFGWAGGSDMLIKYAGGGPNEPLHVTITGPAGTEVVDVTLTDGQGTLPLSGLTTGDYVLKAALSAAVDPPFRFEFYSGQGAVEFVTAPSGYQAPEPGTVPLIGLGVLGACVTLRRRRVKTAGA